MDFTQIPQMFSGLFGIPEVSANPQIGDQLTFLDKYGTKPQGDLERGVTDRAKASGALDSPKDAASKGDERDWSKILQAVAGAAMSSKRPDPPHLAPVDVGGAHQLDPSVLSSVYQNLAQQGHAGASFPMNPIGSLLRGR